MMVRRALLPLLLLCLSAAPSLAQGNAWSRGEGESNIEVSLTFLSSSQIYDLHGKESDLFDDPTIFRDGQYGATDLSFRGELGIFDWLTGTLSTAYQVAVQEAYHLPKGKDSTTSSSGLGDVWLGARIRLLPATDSLFAATFTLAWKAPMGAATQEMPLGTGVADYEGALAVGHRFMIGDLSARAQVGAGYQLRNRASNALTYLAESNVELGRGLTVKARLDGIHSTADFDAAAEGPSSLNRTLVGDRSYLRWGVGTRLRVNETLSLVLDYTKPISGRNALTGSSVTFGLAWWGSGK